MKPIASNVVFHVADIDRAVAFYTTQLGFEVTFEFGEPVGYVGLVCGDVHLHLSLASPRKNNVGHGNIYLIYAEVDALYQKLVAADVGFYAEIADRPYGMRDFTLKDPDENQIGIGADLPTG